MIFYHKVQFLSIFSRSDYSGTATDARKEVELFASQSADGWDRWGNEAPEDQMKEDDSDDNIQKEQDRKSGLFQAAL